MKRDGKKLLKRTLLIVGILLLNISCDQVSKGIVRDKLVYNERVDVLKNHIILTKVENTGAFLSIGSNLSPILKTSLLWVLPSLALLSMLFFTIFNRKLKIKTALAFACIVGGGLGNIFDRISYGSVTDFMILDFGFVKTGVFNAADVSIMAGAAYLLLAELIGKKGNLK